MMISILSVLLALFMPLAFGKAAWDLTPNRFTQNDYGNIMGENIEGNPRVVDIAMLGAHNAFSTGINARSSLDPNSRDMEFLRDNPWTMMFGNGLAARFARTQKSSPYDLARRGVRFFDVRATFIDGEWYAAHGLVAAPLADCLGDLIRFMDETEGEVLVISFHQSLGGYIDYLVDYALGVTRGGKALRDFVRYDMDAIPLGQLRYEDATGGGSGAVIACSWDVYGLWHDTNDPDALLRDIGEWNEELKTYMGWRANYLRWNQAQLTAQWGWPALLRAAPDWSLLAMAHRLNHRLLGDLPAWLPQMPILSVDYADDMNCGFNDRAIEIINEYNRELG